MDINTVGPAVGMLVMVMGLIVIANLLDFGLRTMAREKAERAEARRVAKWGLPAPKSPPPPKQEGVWHFNDEP